MFCQRFGEIAVDLHLSQSRLNFSRTLGPTGSASGPTQSGVRFVESGMSGLEFAASSPLLVSLSPHRSPDGEQRDPANGTLRRSHVRTVRLGPP
ncbi:unnamed protein product [Protopolystoma xenopodis]|uniref:Uncharacterized protein n=1 Tax=Protopolystoma xenopodis TaxID=117903 RepID=A0A448XMG5_9PLAT|nr:unnamed protein product [Protopolystoma xenopodis]